MKTSSRKRTIAWYHYFYVLILFAAILDIVPGGFVIALIAVSWLCSGIFGLIILCRLALRKQISTGLVIAALPGLITSVWLLLMAILGSIYKISPCGFGPQDIPWCLIRIAIFHWPIWFAKDKRLVLRHAGLQFILLLVIDWRFLIFTWRFA